MAVIAKRNQIHVKCLNPSVVENQQESWSCKIDEGALGMVGQMWAPDSRQIITFSDLQLRATVWSLVEQKPIANIRNPKLVPPKGVSITKNGKFIAVAERKDAKDWVSIYYTGGEWKLVNTFEVDTFDMADLMWCKEDTSILVYDSALECKFLVYSALTGECTGRPNLQQGSACQLGLGIKSVCLSPNLLFTAVAFFDTKLRIFNGIS